MGTSAAEKATFAGGCFWCMEAAFDRLEGVLSVTPGYTGGRTADPTYEEVSSGTTGHAEAVQVTYDPSRIGYGTLLSVFWRNIDPTTPDRQFCDVGTQYRPAVFYHDEAQRQAAEESKRAVEGTKSFPGGLAVEIAPAAPFWPAEEYHRKYYRKNPIRYRLYREACGRDRRLRRLWEDPR